MVQKDDGGLAFPVRRIENVTAFVQGEGDQFGDVIYPGMSLRDWFAGQVMAGIGTWTPQHPGGTGLNEPGSHAVRAAFCYAQADAMLAARAKGQS